MTIFTSLLRAHAARAFATGVALSLTLLGPLNGAPALRREIEPNARRGQAAAVVTGDVALAHTAGLLPVDREGRLVGAGDVAGQTDQVLANLEHALRAAGASFESLVKLNLAVRDAAASGDVEKALARRFGQKPKPAVTLVVSDQRKEGALISGDAIAIAEGSAVEVRRVTSPALHAGGKPAQAAILPAGPKIFFSGKGGRGPTRETTESLMADLKLGMDHMQVRPADVAQIRVFLKQMPETAELEEVMAQFFGASGVPPITYLDREAGEGAMEIEMVAKGRPEDARRAEQVEYFTPPKWKPSPQFSQVARFNRGGLIYVSGLRGEPTDNGEKQAEVIFARLGTVIRASGGDLQHLAKALYYITGKEGSAGMDKVRPKAFDPRRPPAASRNTLRHVGGNGGVMLVDMIGVVVEK